MSSLDKDFRPYSRINMHVYFIEIAQASRQEVKVLQNSLFEHIKAGYEIIEQEPMPKVLLARPNEVRQVEELITKEVIKAIIFLAMYCEAYIWDLAASMLGDAYSKKYLDKLDTLSKWMVIPKMLFGKGLNAGHHSIEKLKELIRWRNEFVHSKSKDASGIFENPTRFKADFIPLDQKINLEELFSGITDLFLELQKIDSAGHHRLI